MPDSLDTDTLRRRPVAISNLVGQLLIAQPGMPDPRFAHTVVYMVTHGPEGAMGIVINRPSGQMDFAGLLAQLDIPPHDTPREAVMNGGPLEGGHGYVLHSDEYKTEGTIPVEHGIALTRTVEVLRAIASGAGPARRLIALGYSGWQAGQLEEELQGSGWLTAPAHPDIVFHPAVEEKWEMALARLGATPAHLSSQLGRA